VTFFANAGIIKSSNVNEGATMNADQIRDKAMEREAIAVDLLSKADTKRAWEFLNLYSDNGNFLEDDDVDQIIAEFGPKGIKDATIHNFTDTQVCDIRNRRKAGISLKILASEYGCSKALISKIARGLIYKGVK
jgi:muconolactone delta-isomerase